MTTDDPYGLRGRIPVPKVQPKRHHRRIAKLGAGALHPACRAAYTDGIYEGPGAPCGRCSWLLGLDNDSARFVDAHVDDGEDEAS